MSYEMLIDVPPSFGPTSQPARRLSRKQKAIVDYLRLNGTITTAQATELVGRNVYYNQAKHTGAVLSNMVKRGIIRRLRVGVYGL